MKKIQAIVRPSVLEPLKETCAKAGISGMTISAVHGSGNQHGYTEFFRGSEVEVNTLHKIQVEFVVSDDDVEKVIDMIIATCRTGEVGDGKIFIIPVEEVVRIRTGERGVTAV